MKKGVKKSSKSSTLKKWSKSLLHLCASKMRMEPLLFADENAPEWAFSKRKCVKKASKIDAIWLYLFRLLMKGIVEQTHG